MRKMQWMVVLFLCIFLLTACSGEKEDTNTTQEEQIADSESQEIDSFAPDFTTTLLSGEDFTLSEHKGEVVMLNFWATWCGPCVSEMPALQRLQEEYGGKVTILGVNIGEAEETVDAFLSENSYTYPMSYDMDRSIFSLYPSDSIPYTVIIGTDGKVAQTIVGAKSEEEQYQILKDLFDTYLDQ